MVNPYYEYCNILWANAKTRYVDKLSTSQKKILCIVSKLKWSDHVDDIYVKFNFLDITGINICHTGCFMFKAVNGLLHLHNVICHLFAQVFFCMPMIYS